VARAQEEHDQFAGLLRSRGVEVLLLSDLLTEALNHSGAARMQGLPPRSMRAGSERLWRKSFRPTCGAGPGPAGARADAGMTFNDYRRTPGTTCPCAPHAPRSGFRHRAVAQSGVHPRLVDMDRATGGDTDAGAAARVREASLTDIIYAHHPRFTGVRRAYESRTAPVEGGDVLLLAPCGRGRGRERTTRPVRRRWRAVSLTTTREYGAGRADRPDRAQMHLDTVCTMVDTDTVVMYANIVDTLSPSRFSAPPMA